MKYLIPALMACFISIHAKAQAEVYAPGGSAINGYDVVAFFKESKQVKGSATYSYQYMNATWLFANKENRDNFIATPSKYAPQYGGYCAYGTAEGHKAPTEANTWTIVNEKLYFNYNKQVKKMWMKDQAHLIDVADLKWPEVKFTKE